MSKLSINVEGHDPSMRNWAKVFAVVHIEDGKPTIEIKKSYITRTNNKVPKGMVKSYFDVKNAGLLYEGAVKDYETNNIEIAFVEVPHGAQSASGMRSLGTVQGILGSMIMNGFNYINLSAYSLKKFIGEDDSKLDIMKWAYENHPNSVEPYIKKNGKVNKSLYEHVADAILAVHVGIETKEFKEFLKQKLSENILCKSN